VHRQHMLLQAVFQHTLMTLGVVNEEENSCIILQYSLKRSRAPLWLRFQFSFESEHETRFCKERQLAPHTSTSIWTIILTGGEVWRQEIVSHNKNQLIPFLFHWLMLSKDFWIYGNLCNTIWASSDGCIHSEFIEC
jgi:hypothetical protein